ncbi:hypothetical protein CKAN_00044400 [Cinnamomum micranthum f. kanehirae]|uniref:DUF789 domain-containing protein n=1 Tax=Cinnamomum micranthum f. kanehirae TaxID=337451 RepID=A0A443N134_9MAGN|nr:hypothetical protein CKAN_00044400 [Cinnamomum micranthum f. kanehirae]
MSGSTYGDCDWTTHTCHVSTGSPYPDAWQAIHNHRQTLNGLLTAQDWTGCFNATWVQCGKMRMAVENKDKTKRGCRGCEMLGAGLHFGRGEDRFYNPMKARRNHQNQLPQRPRNGGRVSAAAAAKGRVVNSENREVESRSAASDEAAEVSGSSPVKATRSNLDRFLESTTPSVPAQYLPKTTMRERRTCDVESQPYFVLGDLWESFQEWSVYGAGVPLVLNESDSVVQYYVPYLSGIQIYGESATSAVKLRQPGEDSDGEYYRDSSSDGSSDCELERGLKHKWEQWNRVPASEAALRMDRLSLRETNVASQEGFSSDEGEVENSQGCRLFEFLEQDLPYSREPLADKATDLSRDFPELKTLRSCDLLPKSWISVAWYPIYRIPTGQTLRDLDACFLTFHNLSTLMSGAGSVQGPIVTYPDGIDGMPKISLPVFGLASYKFKSSMWTLNGGLERQLANSLLQVADNWLRDHDVDHPDFRFFASRGTCHR